MRSAYEMSSSPRAHVGSSTENKSICNPPLFAAGNLTHHLYLGTWHKAFGAGETVPGSKLDAENCDRRRRSVWAAVGIGTATEQLRSHGCFQPDTGADLKRPGHFQPVHVSRFFAE